MIPLNVFATTQQNQLIDFKVIQNMKDQGLDQVPFDRLQQKRYNSIYIYIDQVVEIGKHDFCGFNRHFRFSIVGNS